MTESKTAADTPVTTHGLSPLGYKIFLDRYALKDGSKKSLSVGDTVVVCVDVETGQREIGKVVAAEDGRFTIELNDGTRVEKYAEHIDKPLELTPAELQARVARGIASVEQSPELRDTWEKNFRQLMEDWKFVPGGRILTAAGSDQNLTLYNCFVIPSPRDSRGGIVQTLSQMMEIMSRGGGVGINVSSLRPRHSYVKGVNGRSSGAVSWGALYSFVTGLIEQGGSRRGALMLICDVWHPDVLEFIASKTQMGKITNANISVAITDAFMEAIERDEEWELCFPDTSDPHYEAEWDGSLEKWQAAGRSVVTYRRVRARELWDRIVESAWASAEPGLFFVDRANYYSNSHYYCRISCTNPCGEQALPPWGVCLAGESLVHTDRGLVRIDELVRRFNAGEQFWVLTQTDRGTVIKAPVTAAMHNGRRPTLKLTLRNGLTLRLTGNHEVYTERGWVRADQLLAGDQVRILDHTPVVEPEPLLTQEMMGWVTGDGSYLDYAVGILWSARDQQAMDRLKPVWDTFVGKEYAVQTQPTGVRQIYSTHSEVRRRFAAFGFKEGRAIDKEVPASMLEASEREQISYLRGLFSADGSVAPKRDRDSTHISLASSSRQLLHQVQVILFHLGIQSNLLWSVFKQSPRNPQGRLDIRGQSARRFVDLVGFNLDYKNEAFVSTRRVYRRRAFHEVKIVEPDATTDVYDITVDGRHSFFANGILVHNCNLGAVNLGRFAGGEGRVRWDELGQSVRHAVRFLDNVIDATPYFFEENERQQKGERRVGLGTMGLAELLIRCGVRYGSPESMEFIDRLYRFIAVQAYLASADYAAEKGSFPQFDAEKLLQSRFMESMPPEVRQAVGEKGLRNVTLLTQAPTGTTGTMVGTSTGIEPFYFWSYYRKSRLGMHEEKVSVLQEWLDEHGQDEPLPDHFVTAMDLTPEEHVRIEAAIQRRVDSSISKTCNVPNHWTVEQTRELYELMYRLGCKGGTIYRDGSRDEQVLYLKKEEEKGADEPVLKVRPVPKKRYGVTVSRKTPAGTAHITMNDDEEGRPFEIFVEIGKGGSDIKAMAEALGRMMSLVLRLASPLRPKERIWEMINQLEGIGGARSTGFGPGRVRSLPDAVAQALTEQYGNGNGNGQGSKPHAVESPEVEVELASPTAGKLGRQAPLPGMSADLCPSCGDSTLVRIEGCHSCYQCGYAEC